MDVANEKNEQGWHDQIQGYKKQIEQLQSKIKSLEADCKILTVRPTLAEFNLLQSQLDKVKEALEKYGEHSKKCYKNLTIGGFCDCGLEQALETKAQDEEGRADK